MVLFIDKVIIGKVIVIIHLPLFNLNEDFFYMGFGGKDNKVVILLSQLRKTKIIAESFIQLFSKLYVNLLGHTEMSNGRLCNIPSFFTACPHQNQLCFYSNANYFYINYCRELFRWMNLIIYKI